MELRGIGVVVSGGGSGLGEATARLFSTRGAKVAVLDLGRSKGAEVARSLGDDALFVEADVTNEAQVAAALDRAVGELGAIRALVNCAGIGTPGRVVDKKGEPLALASFSKVILVRWGCAGAPSCFELW